jgi:hypothetical protein
MFQRGFTYSDVYGVADMGEVIEYYPDDTPYPSSLLLGWIGSRPVHVVLANNALEGVHVVVTLYEPEDVRWQPDFRRRRP